MNWNLFHQQIFPIRDKLYRFALRITGNVHDAEDVVQEVLERVWKSSEGQSEAVQNWEAWCMTMTRNRSLDKSRSNSNRRTTGVEVLEMRSNTALLPDKNAELQDLASHIRTLMQALPDKQRMVMHLRDIEELSYDEIAQTLELSLDQVKINLHRARKAIRSQIAVVI